MMILKVAVAFVFIVCFVRTAESQKPPREYVRSKCEKRVKNETLLAKCKECVEQYALTESPSKDEIKSMIRECVPRKHPKEWIKGKCEEITESEEEAKTCLQCVDDYVLPKNVTRDDMKGMKKTCLPKPGLKLKAKKKCTKKLKEREDIEACKSCIDSYVLPEKASCEEVSEMKRQCIAERSGREMWVEPLMRTGEEDEEEFE